MAKCDWFYYIHPSIWNEMKFHLYRGMNLVYNGELPQYVIDFCNKTDVNLIPFSEKDIYNYEERFYKLKKEWLHDDVENNNYSFEVNLDDLWNESWDDIVDEKTLYIECNVDNICTTLYNMREYKFRSIQRGWLELGYKIIPLFWKEFIPSLNENQIHLIEKFDNIALASAFDVDKFVCRISLFPNSVDEITERKYIHITSSDGGRPLPYYRRYFLNDKLNKKWGDDLATNAFLGVNTSKLCVVSHPSNYIPQSEKIFYDRSDNWKGSGMDKDSEDYILEKADYITCSSKWLYNDTLKYLKENRPNDDVKVKYIPNGNVMFDYPTNVEKFEKPTAIYVGARIKKTDLQLIYLLCEMNPNWNFMLYGEGASDLLSIPSNLFVHETVPIEELFPIICKCHVGLITLKENEWTVGMLPNKVFNYINARIPIIYSGIPDINMEDYKEFSYNISDISSLDEVLENKTTAEIFDSYKRDWSTVCNEIISCIDELENN